MIVDNAELLRKKDLEHAELQFETFSNKRALELGLRLVEVAEERNLPVAIDIRRNSQQLFHYACEGTSADNDQWIERKSRVADRFGKSSSYIKALIAGQGSTLEKMFALDSKIYSAYGGAFPIIIRNTGVVGTVTVSGLPDDDDHNLVVSVIKEFI